MAAALPVTGDPEADLLLEAEPLALLIGMLLDQQVPMEWAFHAPYDLKQRLGGNLSAADIAARDPDDLGEVFKAKPALHRFPGSMAKRVHELCRQLVAEYDGQAERVWTEAKGGDDLKARIRKLPGFGEDKTRIFIAVLAKRFGVKPPGWEGHAADWASVADIDSADAVARVREAKRAMKATKKTSN